MALARYNQKRNFSNTDEPKSGKSNDKNKLIFVIQKHNASRLHYDFRLEMEGVLKSWAVPKGPSMNPKLKRLAIMVEDHPFDYKDFEGIIPKGEYGAGTVIIWDQGWYETIETIKGKKAQEKYLLSELKKGSVKVRLHGEQLNGEFALVRTNGMGENSWLLIKHEHEFSSNMKPMLATLVNEPFDDPDWQYEVKWDGYRALAVVDKGKANLLSRNHNSFNDKFYPIYDIVNSWQLNAVFDGEIVVLNDKGISNFTALQNWESEADGQLIYYVFDILRYQGKDLTGLTLVERQSILNEVLPTDDDSVRISNVFDTSGIEFFDAAKRMGLEGIMAKRKSSTYLLSGRSKEWLKIKVSRTEDVIVAGFTRKEKTSKLFSALILAVWENKVLTYAGKVGTGFSNIEQKKMMTQFKPLITASTPFKVIPAINKRSKLQYNQNSAETIWMKPELVCEIGFTEITENGVFRHPSFKGMRIGKFAKDLARLPQKPISTILLNPKDQTQVKMINGKEIKFTHLSKVYWPEEGITKREMINYYDQVADFILPYLKDRPQSLNRYPGGINGHSFYQKDVKGKAPSWAKTFPYSTSDGEPKEYVVGDDLATLLWMVSLGCIEINPWFSRVQFPDYPDYCVIDLDPDQQHFDKVIEVALAIKSVLDSILVPSFPKTSGSTGMHIYIPMGAKYSYRQSQLFAKIIVGIVNNQLPDFTSLERMISARKGKMYLDFMQNRPGATIAGPYSLRPKVGATVSMPLEWEEVKVGLKMTDFTIFNALERLRIRGDIFVGVLGKGIDLEKAIKKAKEIYT